MAGGRQEDLELWSQEEWGVASKHSLLIIITYSRNTSITEHRSIGQKRKHLYSNRPTAKGYP